MKKFMVLTTLAIITVSSVGCGWRCSRRARRACGPPCCSNDSGPSWSNAGDPGCSSCEPYASGGPIGGQFIPDGGYIEGPIMPGGMMGNTAFGPGYSVAPGSPSFAPTLAPAPR